MEIPHTISSLSLFAAEGEGGGFNLIETIKKWDAVVWLCIVIGALVLLLFVALVVISAGMRLKIPGIVMSTIASLVAGFALAVALLMSFGHRVDKSSDSGDGKGGGGGMMGGGGKGGGMMGGGMMGGGMMGGGKGGKDGEKGGKDGGKEGKQNGDKGGKKGGGGMMGGGGGGGGPPTPTVQLTNLVTKLDKLTNQPINFKFKPQTSKKINEQLKGLGELKELTDSEAKKRLEGLKDALVLDEEASNALEAVGFAWEPPPPSLGSPPPAKPNPFTDGKEKNQLNRVQEALTKGAN